MNHSWTFKRITDVYKPLVGLNPNNVNSDYGFPFLSYKTVYKKPAMKKLLPDGAIVFRKPASVSHMFITKGTLLVRESHNTIIPDESVGTPYLYYSLQYSAYRIEKALAGTTHRRLTTKDLRKITLVAASKDKIKWFNNFCLMPFKKQLALQNENECLHFLMEKIIEKFITQKIAGKRRDDYEPKNTAPIGIDANNI